MKNEARINNRRSELLNIASLIISAQRHIEKNECIFAYKKLDAILEYIEGCQE